MLEKDNGNRRIFTDEEIIFIREDFAKQTKLGIYEYCKTIPLGKGKCGSYYNVLIGRVYRFLLPGQAYRIRYDAEKQKTIQ